MRRPDDIAQNIRGVCDILPARIRVLHNKDPSWQSMSGMRRGNGPHRNDRTELNPGLTICKEEDKDMLCACPLAEAYALCAMKIILFNGNDTLLFHYNWEYFCIRPTYRLLQKSLRYLAIFAYCENPGPWSEYTRPQDMSSETIAFCSQSIVWFVLSESVYGGRFYQLVSSQRLPDFRTCSSSFLVFSSSTRIRRNHMVPNHGNRAAGAIW
jgi:hypothetical protein